MKEIDVAQARSIIYELYTSGAKGSARLVWDLLDMYITYPTQPIVFQTADTAAELGPIPPQRCEISNDNGSACMRKASGRVGSVRLCYPHGQKLAAQAKVPFISYKSEVPEGDLGCEIHTITSGSPCTFRPVGYLRRIGQADLHLCNFHSKHPVVMKPAFTLYAAE